MAGAPTSMSCSGVGRLIGTTATCETVAVVAAEALWLVVAMPTYAVVPSAIVLLSMRDQVVPSAEEYAVTFVPTRDRRTHLGGVTPGPLVLVLEPPSCSRR